MQVEFSAHQVPALETALRRAVSPKSGTMPLLSCVKISLRLAETRILVESTDLSVARREEIPINSGISAGVVLVDRTKLLKIVSRAKKTKRGVKLVSDASNLRVLVGKSEFKIHTYGGANDWPNLDDWFPQPVNPLPPAVEFNTAELLDCVEVAKAHASRDEARATLNSLCVALEGDRLAMVTTDGHRLARSYPEVGSPTESLRTYFSKPSVIVYEVFAAWKEALAGALKIKHKPPGTKRQVPKHQTCRVHFLRDAACLEVADILVAAKFVNATFPPYLQVIPKRSDARLVVHLDPEQTIRSLEDAILVAPEVTATTRFDIDSTSSATGVLVSASNPDIGEFSATLPAKVETLREPRKATKKAESNTAGFNAGHVAEALKHLGPSPTMRYKDALDPALFVSEDGSRDITVMPMRIE